MREIKYYESFDGVLFNTIDKCREYETNLHKKTVEDFKKLIVRQAEGIRITNEGSAFPLAEIAECWWYGVIVMKNEDDYETVQRFAGGDNRIQRIFNKEIIVCLGDGTSEECDYNSFYWCGPVEDAIENYKKAIMTFGEENK